MGVSEMMQQIGPRSGPMILKIMKVMPVIGYVFVLGEAPEVLKKKGFVLGSLAVALDMLPVVCLLKAGIEIFTGDLIPDRSHSEVAQKLTQNLQQNLEVAA
jgi:hypothetical protein